MEWKVLTIEKTQINLVICSLIRTFADALEKERCSSGWRGTPGKRVTGKTGSQVRILFSPQDSKLRGKTLELCCSLRESYI